MFCVCDRKDDAQSFEISNTRHSRVWYFGRYFWYYITSIFLIFSLSNLIYSSTELRPSYRLKSSRYKKESIIDEQTSGLTQYGLNWFYKFLTNFLMEIRAEKILFHDEYVFDIDDEDIQALSFEQIKRPFILFLCCLILTLIALIIEIIIYEFKKRRHHVYRHWKYVLVCLLCHCLVFECIIHLERI